MVDIRSNTTPELDAFTYLTGQTIDLLVTNPSNLTDITRVEVFCEDQLIGDFGELPPGGVSFQYTLTDPGVDIFWTQVTYLFNDQPTYATDYFVASVVPEPATFVLLCGSCLLATRKLRRRRY